MILEIKGLLDVSPLGITPEEIQQGFNDWLKKNVCNFHGSIIVTLAQEVSYNQLKNFNIPEPAVLD